MEATQEVKGSCHCGTVQFVVIAPPKIVVQRCNCSICSATGFVHYIVPAKRFQLLVGAQKLTEYRFNTRQAKHLFCSVCGVKAFYVPRSNPDGFSINVNCVNWPKNMEITEENFDGQNWEANAPSLKHLSES
jgi:hypothetical protein